MDWSQLYHLSNQNWFTVYGFIYPAVAIFVLFWIFAFGACIGSFLNVCIWRIPRGESLSKAASHCTVCGAPIKWYDNIPVASYLILRGRCRSCRTPYSSMYFWVELVTGVLVTLVVLKTGLSNQLAQIIPERVLLIFFGVSCSMTDIRFRVVPDKLTYSGMVFALLTAFALPEAWGTADHFFGAAYSLAAGLIAGWFLFLFAEFGKMFTGKDVVGMGDVKFLALCGMLIGLPGTLFALLAGSWAGALWGIVVKRSFSAKLAFVPFIFLAALVWIFFDRQILDFYLKLFVQL